MDGTTTHPVYGSPRLAGEIIAAMREPFALLGPDLRLVAASPAFFLRFSLDPATTVGAPLFQWGAGEWDTPLTRELFEDLAPRREVVESYSLEVRFNGTERPRVHASVRPLRTTTNRIDGYLFGVAEVAGEPVAGGGLLPRRTTRDLAAVLDPATWCFTAAEGAARQLLGYTTAELVGMPLGALVHSDDRPNVGARFARVAAGAGGERITFRARHRDGWWIWLEALCDPISQGDLPGGRPLVHFVARDVSDRRRAEESLRWLSRQTKLILDSAADGIFGVDTRGTITFINPGAARLLGYRVPDLLGRNYRELLFLDRGAVERGPGAAADPIEQTLRDGLGREIRDHSLRCSDGAELAVEISCNPARDRREITGAVITFRGIADRKRAEAAVRRAEWLAGVGETTIAVRHEINNPLTTLLAEARLLEMGGNSPEEEREMVGAICAQARRIAEVIRRLSERQDNPVVRIEGNQRMLDLRAWSADDESASNGNGASS